MKGVNKVILIGNVGCHPEICYRPSGDAIANVSLALATNETWTDKAGQKQERTEWHRVVFFGKLAEVVEKYVSKGSKLYVEGKLRTRKWQDKDGRDRYSTEVVVDMNGTMQMLDGRTERPQSDSGGGGRSDYSKASQSRQRPAQAPETVYPTDTAPDYDDDIPF